VHTSVVLATSFSQWLLLHFPSWVLFGVTVGACTGISMGGLLVVRRWLPHFSEGVNNTVGGVLMAILGTMYAVVVGFVVVTLWTTFDRAEETTRQEAGALLDVYRDNTALSFKVASQTQEAVREYASTVIDEEWERLAHGESSRKADRAAIRLFEVFRDFEPANEFQSTMFSSSTSRYNDLLDARRTRLSLASAGLPGVFWMAILLGAASTIGFAVFFGQPSHIGAQLVMTGALGFMVGLMLALVLLMNHPFTGDLKVTPGPFVQVLESG
jgi:hypothetical protein